MAPRPVRQDRRADLLVAGVLGVAAVAYLAALPRADLGADEGSFLYEAKRLLVGDCFYRDFFDLVTPGSFYVMAAVFRVFGVNMAAARLTEAVLHGGIVATIYGTCRMLGVRRGLAVAVALVHVALFRPAWPLINPHWFGVLLTVLLLPAMLRRPGTAFVPGLLVGLLIAVHQQKGVVLALGVMVCLVLETFAAARPASGLGRRLLAFGAGVGLVVGPLAAFLISTAGPGPVIEALVQYPLINYRRINRTTWGSVTVMNPSAHYTIPGLLAYLPAVIVVLAARVLGAGHSEGAERRRRSMVLLVTTLAALGSIAYYPDYIHLAFVGPMCVVVLADVLEWALGALAAWPRLAHAAGVVLATALLAGSLWQLQAVMAMSWRQFPLSHQTAFGTLQFRSAAEIASLEEIQQTLDTSASRELFIYPWGAGHYLLTGTVNPTPYQWMDARYSGPDQMQKVIDILEQRRVRHVLVMMFLSPAAGDPVLDYMVGRYRSTLRPIGLLEREEDPPTR